MSNGITKEEKTAIINEEIERYYGESRKTLAELSSLFDVIRYNVETIDSYGAVFFSANELKRVKRGEPGSCENLEKKLDALSDSLEKIIEKIIENARKTREKITSVKLAAGSIEALRKAL